MTIYDGSKNYGHQTGQLKLWVDRRTIWSALVDTSGSMIFINSPKGDIYIDIQRGRQLYIDLDNDNMAEYRFSLDGSAAALPVLVDCINKIGGLRG